MDSMSFLPLIVAFTVAGLIVTLALADVFGFLVDTVFWVPSSRPCNALATDFSQFALQSSLKDVLRTKKMLINEYQLL